MVKCTLQEGRSFLCMGSGAIKKTTFFQITTDKSDSKRISKLQTRDHAGIEEHLCVQRAFLRCTSKTVTHNVCIYK